MTAAAPGADALGPVTPGGVAAGGGPARAFASILWRDVFVTGRELPVFLAQVVLQPFFFVFVFGKILTNLGFARGSYIDVLVPGIIALTVVITGIQSTALPLVIEFGWTKEIEDRLLAPLPTAWVAMEKVTYATIRALIAGAAMFPISLAVIGAGPFRADRVGPLIGFLVLAAIAGAAMGLVLGTLVDAKRINIIFALVLTPLLFTGCSEYPWPALHHIVWFQDLTLVNPLTYASEGLRSSMIPHIAHLATWIDAVVLAGAIVVLLAVGAAGFRRRALD
ncbi:MAG: ABC transporter permease [Acidimicrobiales bacterium]